MRLKTATLGLLAASFVCAMLDAKPADAARRGRRVLRATTVTARVRSSDTGRPIARARVTIRTPRGRTVACAYANARGQVAFRLPPQTATYRIRFEAARHVTATSVLHVRLGRDHRTSCSLRRRGPARKRTPAGSHRIAGSSTRNRSDGQSRQTSAQTRKANSSNPRQASTDGNRRTGASDRTSSKRRRQ
jgi:carboxypeptidase family protein